MSSLWHFRTFDENFGPDGQPREVDRERLLEAPRVGREQRQRADRSLAQELAQRAQLVARVAADAALVDQKLSPGWN